MNIISIDKHFTNLNKLGKYYDYQYEPQAEKYGNNWKRHYFFKDFKDEIVNDLTAYGFSPFICQSYYSQKKNPNIMKFKPKKFNYGFLNYIHKRNRNIPLQEKAFPLKSISGSKSGINIKKGNKSLKLNSKSHKVLNNLKEKEEKKNIKQVFFEKIINNPNYSKLLKNRELESQSQSSFTSRKESKVIKSNKLETSLSMPKIKNIQIYENMLITSIKGDEIKRKMNSSKVDEHNLKMNEMMDEWDINKKIKEEEILNKIVNSPFSLFGQAKFIRNSSKLNDKKIKKCKSYKNIKIIKNNN